MRVRASCSAAREDRVHAKSPRPDIDARGRHERGPRHGSCSRASAWATAAAAAALAMTAG
jgi:hypothetical protein